MLRENWSGLVPAVVRDLPAAFRRLILGARAVTDLQKAEKTAMEARALAERAACEAQVAHTHLLEALDVVPEGIVLFDSDDRFIMWNRRYVEMYGHSTIAVGKSFAEILREGLARGALEHD